MIPVTFHIEPFADAWPEIKVLAPANAIEAGERPVRVDHRKYLAAADRGVLLCVIARTTPAGGRAADERGRVVGYFISLLAPDMHHAGEMLSFSDAFYMSPECRSLPNARRMFSFIGRALTMMGADRDWVGVPDTDEHNLVPLLERMGYRRRQVVLERVLQ